MSRLDSINTAVGVHVTAAFTAASEMVTLFADPDAFDNVKKEQMPAAITLFAEEEPERLPFKQQRRRVTGEIHIAMASDGATAVTREVVDARIEAIRDLVFADEDLGATVDDITAEAGFTTSNPDDPIFYGLLEISTEEVF